MSRKGSQKLPWAHHVVTSTGFSMSTKSEIKSKVELLGGVYHASFTEDCTLLIAKDVTSEKYRAAVTLQRPIMTLEFLQKLASASSSQRVSEFEQFLKGGQVGRLPCFTGLQVSVSQLDQNLRKVVQQKITTYGGTYSRDFHKECHLLIVPAVYATSPLLSAGQSQSDKVAFATAHRIPVVSIEWIDACVQRKECVSWEPFRVQMMEPSSTFAADAASATVHSNKLNAAAKPMSSHTPHGVPQAGAPASESSRAPVNTAVVSHKSSVAGGDVHPGNVAPAMNGTHVVAPAAPLLTSAASAPSSRHSMFFVHPSIDCTLSDAFGATFPNYKCLVFPHGLHRDYVRSIERQYTHHFATTVSVEYLQACMTAKRLEDVHARMLFTPVTSVHAPGSKDHTMPDKPICFTGFTNSPQDEAWMDDAIKVFKALGATVDLRLFKRTSVLIVNSATEQSASAKVAKAHEWNIPVVSERFVMACRAAGCILSPSDFVAVKKQELNVPSRTEFDMDLGLRPAKRMLLDLDLASVMGSSNPPPTSNGSERIAFPTFLRRSDSNLRPRDATEDSVELSTQIDVDLTTSRYALQ